MKRRVFVLIVAAALVAGIYLVGSSFRDQANTIAHLKQIEMETNQALGILTRATDPRLQKAQLIAFYKALRQEIQHDLGQVRVAVQQSSGTRTVVVTRTVPSPTRTVFVTRCVRPSGRPC